jgi:uncharacterized protein (DUF58 family)
MNLRGFRLASRALALESGERRSNTVGSGGEFLEFRAYQPGDDVRRVDWNVYARSGKLFIRRFEAERASRTYALIDTSASMEDKREQAKQTLELLHNLARADRWLERSVPNLPASLIRLAQDRPGLIVIISDGLEPLSNWRDGFAALRARNFDVSFVQVLSKDDLEPPTGAWRVQDAESESKLEVDDTTRLTYLARLEAHLEGLAAMIRGFGFRIVRLEVGNSSAESWARLRRAGVLERGV